MTTPSPPAESRDDLTQAVHALLEEVKGLRGQLSLYAPRDEVRREGRSRAWRFLAFAVAIVIVAQAMTMTTISYCFLDANNRHKPLCDAMPGYAQSVDQNEIRLGRFEKVLGAIESNGKRIDDIERRLDALEKRSK